MKIRLKPIIHRDSYTVAVEAEIVQFLDEAIFDPLRELLEIARVPEPRKNGRRENAKDGAVREALDSGRLWYAEGAFYGDFSPAVARELRSMGATFSASEHTFRIPTDRLPFDLRGSVVRSVDRSKEIHVKVESFLAAAEENVRVAVSAIEVDQTISRIRGDLYRQWQGATKGLDLVEVVPDFTPEINASIAKDFTNNLDRYVKNFLATEIPEMRAEVAKNAYAGYRSDRLAGVIEARYGVSKRKAAFLADQETSLLVSRYRQAKAAEVGALTYEWSTSHDERVRPDHRRLDGGVFAFASPPVTCLKTGAKNNPGEDFRCLPGTSRVEFCGRIEKGFRRRFHGELTEIVLESGKTIHATPNHPVLTTRGWKAIGLVNDSDHLVELSEETLRVAMMKAEGQKGVTSIREKFETLGEAGLREAFMGQREQFHGDGANGNVDVIWTAWGLFIDRKTAQIESIRKRRLVEAAAFAASRGGPLQHQPLAVGTHQSTPDMTLRRQLLALFESRLGHAEEHRLGPASDRDPSLDQSAPDNHALKPYSFRDGEFTLAPEIGFDDGFWVKLQAVMGVTARGVLSVRRFDFHGDVFNLQTDCGWYTTEGVIVSNCRCTAIPILELVEA